MALCHVHNDVINAYDLLIAQNQRNQSPVLHC